MSFQVHKVNHDVFVKMTRQAMGYALLSAPFTVNRMSLKSLERRIENILKGKLAEAMVAHFCESQKIPTDFESCSTPFYKIDKRDFILDDYEWDIKNNYLGLERNNFEGIEHLPSLVPDRSGRDQWSKRNELEHASSGVRFLFTFMIKEIGRGRKRQHMLKIQLSPSHADFLKELMVEYKGLPRKESPFDENWFWEKWKELSKPNHPQLLSINFDSPLLVAGWAGSAHWDLFERKSPMVFANGAIKTRIKNRVLESDKLSSFLAS